MNVFLKEKPVLLWGHTELVTAKSESRATSGLLDNWIKTNHGKKSGHYEQVRF